MIVRSQREASRRLCRGNVIHLLPKDASANHVIAERDLIVSRDSCWSAMLPRGKNACRWHDFRLAWRPELRGSERESVAVLKADSSRKFSWGGCRMAVPVTRFCSNYGSSGLTR